MQNLSPKSAPHCVTVYFPIVIGFWEILGVFSFSIGSPTVQHISRALHDGDPTFRREVLHLWRPVAKRKIVNHIRSFPMAQLMSGDDRKLYERS